MRIKVKSKPYLGICHLQAAKFPQFDLSLHPSTLNSMVYMSESFKNLEQVIYCLTSYNLLCLWWLKKKPLRNMTCWLSGFVVDWVRNLHAAVRIAEVHTEIWSWCFHHFYKKQIHFTHIFKDRSDKWGWWVCVSAASVSVRIKIEPAEFMMQNILFSVSSLL